MSSPSAPLQPHSPDISSTDIPQSNAMSIRARGRSFLALILSPEAPLKGWLRGLDQQMSKSVGFFNRQPIILDLSLLTEDEPDLPTLQEQLQKREIRIIGIEGASPEWSALHNWEWPLPLNGGRPSGPVPLPETEEEPESPVSTLQEPLIIDRVVRSGQSIHNPDGDVIIIGAVSSGAEIIAAGSIHVYGPLRGRAIAGVDGRSHARIYTTHMEAELLAINGYYTIAEEMPSMWFKSPAQALLEQDRVTVHPLNDERR